MIGSILTLIVLVGFYTAGFYVGRSSAKDRGYIEGYRDGVKDGGSSIQGIMNKLKKEL